MSESESKSGLKCCSFGASSVSDPQLAVGSFDGKLQLWDLEQPRSPVWDAQAHASMVNNIDAFGGQVRRCRRGGSRVVVIIISSTQTWSRDTVPAQDQQQASLPCMVAKCCADPLVILSGTCRP